MMLLQPVNWNTQLNYRLTERQGHSTTSYFPPVIYSKFVQVVTVSFTKKKIFFKTDPTPKPHDFRDCFSMLHSSSTLTICSAHCFNVKAISGNENNHWSLLNVLSPKFLYTTACMNSLGELFHKGILYSLGQLGLTAMQSLLCQQREGIAWKLLWLSQISLTRNCLKNSVSKFESYFS